MSAAATTEPPRPERVHAIDALRGFDMFWIIGGDALAVAILTRLDQPWAEKLAEQLEHVAWEGFRFYDLIFPLFLFMVGCVLPYSLSKYRDRPSDVYLRIGRRVAALVLLGLIANGLLRYDWENLRLAGVLQRIGICYGLGALVFLHTRVVGQALVVAALLLGYWALLAWVPVPGGIAGDYSLEGNLAGWVDRNFLPGKIYEAYYGFGDNEGLLSTIPAVATVLLGALAGHWLQSTRGAWGKAGGLLLAGVICLAIGYAWGGWFPIIKNLWTSSFVMVTAGWSLLLLSLFYMIMDIGGQRSWAIVFTIIGVNAITIYVAQRFIDFSYTSKFFFGGTAAMLGTWGTVVLIAGTLAAKILFLAFLYRQRVYLRV
jgi:predicted acyltransferase